MVLAEFTFDHISCEFGKRPEFSKECRRNPAEGQMHFGESLRRPNCIKILLNP